MKAIRIHQFGGPEGLKLEDVPDPVPGKGQVVVALKAIGVNPVETYIRSGIYGPKQFPYTPGSDAAGIVEAIGEGVKIVRAGDKVYLHSSITGTYAQRARCAESHVHPLPATITFQQGAAIGVPYATAYRALYHRAQILAGETILIHGASGGVGTAAVQICRAAGLTIFGTAGNEKGIELVRQQGAHHVLNHHDPKYLEELMNLTGGVGVNVILELASHVNLGKDLPMLARYGRVIVVGSRGPVQINPRDTMSRDADIRGMTLMLADEKELHDIHAALGAGLEIGSLRPVIGKEFSLAEAGKAHEEVLASGAHGKIILTP